MVLAAQQVLAGEERFLFPCRSYDEAGSVAWFTTPLYGVDRRDALGIPCTFSGYRGGTLRWGFSKLSWPDCLLPSYISTLRTIATLVEAPLEKAQ